MQYVYFSVIHLISSAHTGRRHQPHESSPQHIFSREFRMSLPWQNKGQVPHKNNKTWVNKTVIRSSTDFKLPMGQSRWSTKKWLQECSTLKETQAFPSALINRSVQFSSIRNKKRLAWNLSFLTNQGFITDNNMEFFLKISQAQSVLFLETTFICISI